jgi:DNA recombination protein RmuC
MSDFASISAFALGLALGGGAAWLALRGRVATESALVDKFKALAADSLRANNEAFLHLAESRMKQTEQAAAATLERKAATVDELVKPVRETLTKLDAQLQALEVKREAAYSELATMVKVSNEVQQQLRGETGQLLAALRASGTRGRWGEIQLKRILEMTGMDAHVKDFTAQQTVNNGEGALRPDYLVHLPGNRCIVIDSKAPLTACLDAAQTTDENARAAAIGQHARQVREHVRLLSSKAYWDQIEGTPEFVVLFMPGDHFLSAALDADPDLMDYSVAQKVVLATPMTLVALLRAVAYGWRQENLNENARKVGALGGELYAALGTMTDHIVSLGGKLAGSLESYNRMIGSLERNVLSKARRLRDFGAGKEGKALPEALEPIDLQPRNLSITSDPANEEAA